MTQEDTHQDILFHGVQVLLDLLHRLYNSHILMLHLSNLR